MEVDEIKGMRVKILRERELPSAKITKTDSEFVFEEWESQSLRIEIT
jgi:hypothetical protein